MRRHVVAFAVRKRLYPTIDYLATVVVLLYFLNGLAALLSVEDRFPHLAVDARQEGSLSVRMCSTLFNCCTVLAFPPAFLYLSLSPKHHSLSVQQRHVLRPTLKNRKDEARRSCFNPIKKLRSGFTLAIRGVIRVPQKLLDRALPLRSWCTLARDYATVPRGERSPVQALS